MRKVLFSVVLAFAGSSAIAAASGSIVFDPTNYSQTLITATQSVKQVTEAVTGNLLKLQQLQELLRQGKAIASGDLNAIAGIVGGSSLQNQLYDIQRVKGLLTNLNGNLGDLSTRFSYASQMANKYGLTLQQYQQAQLQLVAKKNAGAALEQQNNIRVMKDVEDSYNQLRKFQDQTPGTDTQLLQMMNTQMTLLNRNNTQIMAFMAENSSKALIAENEKRAAESTKLANNLSEVGNFSKNSGDARKVIQDEINARKQQYGY